MAPIYQKALFVFRRDLRLADNTALIAAHQMSKAVLPCFVFDPRQVEKHPYRSLNALQFMLESLDELAADIKKKGGQLHFLQGRPQPVLAELIKQQKIEALFLNRDYTPFSIKRDHSLKVLCRKLGIGFHAYGDSLLHEPEEVQKGNGGPYTMFTPFFRRASRMPVRRPLRHEFNNFLITPHAREQKSLFKKILNVSNNNIFVHGGRSQALETLKCISRFKTYRRMRDIPAQAGTTCLSAHNKFGTVSIREVYHAIRDALGPNHLLIQQLFWRDFFQHIAFHFPHVFKGSFRKQYDKIRWENDRRKFKAWCLGRTGFPIVDAGMRQLNTTGYMHNRVRMIVASFLVKDLHIDWRWGEKYFAQKLVDYDPAVNNGNWQWAASTGCDAQPYFRIFNPWRQQKKFDPECRYIKRWLPEVEALSAEQIHKSAQEGAPRPKTYPAPLVDHDMASLKALRMYHS